MSEPASTPIMFDPRDTSTDPSILTTSKTLIYAHHGFGKTAQALHYQRAYGKGYIISGESGLKTLAGSGIHFDVFKSWDTPGTNASRVYSLRQIARLVRSKEFQAAGFKWIMLDSLTEASDLCFQHYEAEEAARPGKKNNWDVYQTYGDNFTEFVRWIRDLPYHVIVTALVKEEKDDNGSPQYWPMLQGQKVQRKLPGMFDYVFAGVRQTIFDPDDLARERPTIVRRLVTEQVNGWYGKVRDPHHRCRPIENESNVTELLRRMEMTPAAYEQYLKATSVTKE